MDVERVRLVVRLIRDRPLFRIVQLHDLAVAVLVEGLAVDHVVRGAEVNRAPLRDVGAGMSLRNAGITGKSDSF